MQIYQSRTQLSEQRVSHHVCQVLIIVKGQVHTSQNWEGFSSYSPSSLVITIIFLMSSCGLEPRSRIVSLDKMFCSTLSLFFQGYKWVPVNMEWHPIHGGVAILLGASCNRNRQRLRPCGAMACVRRYLVNSPLTYCTSCRSLSLLSLLYLLIFEMKI